MKPVLRVCLTLLCASSHFWQRKSLQVLQYEKAGIWLGGSQDVQFLPWGGLGRLFLSLSRPNVEGVLGAVCDWTFGCVGGGGRPMGWRGAWPRGPPQKSKPIEEPLGGAASLKNPFSGRWLVKLEPTGAGEIKEGAGGNGAPPKSPGGRNCELGPGTFDVPEKLTSPRFSILKYLN